MYIWKPLTKKEEAANKNNFNKKEITPHVAFYIDEEKFPEESKVWKALGFNICQEALRRKNGERAESMTLKEIKKALNGMDLYSRIPDHITKLAKENNVAILMGASDDIFSVRGAFYDSFSAYDGFSWKNIKDDKDPVNSFVIDNRIDLIWCPDDTRSWEVQIGSEVEFETFEIMEDGKVFCTGAILFINNKNKD